MGSAFSGKTKTIREVQIDKLNEEGNISFYTKHFINSYVKNMGNPLNTIKSLLLLKTKLNNIKMLERLGYSATAGNIYSVTEQSLVSYLQSIGYKNILINKMKVPEYYLISSCLDYENKWSKNKKECINGCILEWDGVNVKLNTKDYLKYKQVDNNNILIFKTLEIDPNIELTNDNYTYTYNDFIYTYNNITYYDKISYTYHNYKYNGKTYEIIFSGSDINYSLVNNTFTIKLKNIDTGDIIDYTLPINNTKYIICNFNCNEGNKYIIESIEKIITQTNSYTTFLFIPIKHNRKVIDNPNRQAVILKGFGILEPEDSILDDDRIVDLAFSVSSDLITNNSKLDNIMQTLYGSKEQPNDIVVNTSIGDIEYRTVTSTYDCSSDYKILFKGIDISSKNNQYLVPLEALSSLPLNEFYNVYYSLLTSWIYIEEKVKLHWYQTPIFNLILQIGGMFFAAVTGNIEVFLALMALSIIETAFLNDILKNLGFSDNTIIIIETIINIVITIEVGNINSVSSATENTLSSSVSTGLNITNQLSNAYYKIELNNQLQKNTNIQDKYNKQVEILKNEFGNKFLYAPFDALDSLESLRNVDILDSTEIFIESDPLPILDY